MSASLLFDAKHFDYLGSVEIIVFYRRRQGRIPSGPVAVIIIVQQIPCRPVSDILRDTHRMDAGTQGIFIVVYDHNKRLKLRRKCQKPFSVAGCSDQFPHLQTALFQIPFYGRRRTSEPSSARRSISFKCIQKLREIPGLRLTGQKLLQIEDRYCLAGIIIGK